MTQRENVLFQVLIITLLACGGALILLRVIGNDYSEQTWQATLAALPVHHSKQPASSTPVTIDDQSTWKTYKNDQYGFEFRYPGDWSLQKFTSNNSAGLLLSLSLSSPQTQEGMNNGTLSPDLVNLSVTYWKDMNSSGARGGDYEGQRHYVSLEDYFSSPGPFITKIGEITIGGVQGFEVIEGGMGENYAVMVEHGGIYKLSFNAAWDKSAVTPVDKQILSTFKFTR